MRLAGITPDSGLRNVHHGPLAIICISQGALIYIRKVLDHTRLVLADQVSAERFELMISVPASNRRCAASPTLTCSSPLAIASTHFRVPEVVSEDSRHGDDDKASHYRMAVWDPRVLCTPPQTHRQLMGGSLFVDLSP
jgi:hypothetical protein